MTIKSHAQTAIDFAADWEKQHISKMPASQVKLSDLKNYLSELKRFGLKVDEVGRSFGGREIYQAEWGKGPMKIFMWSQMHGDEPTATSALIDMLSYLQNNSKKPWIKDLFEKVTIRAIPMLNPDGAELYQRRNLQFIDINRDARNLVTPEGQLLKKLRDEWKPEIGFNLHNQNPLTTVGETAKQATISLLAVSGNPDNKTSSDAHERNKRLCSVMIAALETMIKGNIGRYDDDYNPRAFGDMMSAWGTQTILIETGALHGKDEMFLIKLNFAAYLTALKALIDGTEKKADPKIYENLPFNGGGLYNAIFRKANIINPAENSEPFLADLAINAERRRANEDAPMFIQEIGDLSVFKGLDEYDAKDFYVVSKSGQLKIGSPNHLFFYRKSKAAKIDWKAADLENKYPPDAIYKDGKWIKGAKLFPRIN